MHPETTPLSEPDEAAEPVELSAGTCMEMLRTTTVGRIVFVDADGIQVRPVNFVLHGERIYFRTSADGTVARVVDSLHPPVFEVDHHEDSFQIGWSVLVTGSVSVLTDPSVAGELAALGRPAPWAPGLRTHVLELVPSTISGRSVHQRRYGRR